MSNQNQLSDQTLQQPLHYQYQHFPTEISPVVGSKLDYSDSNREIDQVVRRNKRSTSKQKKNKTQQDNSNPVYFEFTEVFVWGDDSSGQLGLYHQKVKKGTKDQLSFKVPKTCSFNIVIKQVACGEAHSAILTNQGHLYMMGSNTEGQLGIGESFPQFQARESAGAPCLVDSLRDLKIGKVFCGSNFTIIIIPQINPIQEQQDVIYAWGSNKFGQLGIQNIDKSDKPIRIPFFDIAAINVIDISCGKDHSLFLNEVGRIYGCGSNSYGQLGFETNSQVRVYKPTLLASIKDIHMIQCSAGSGHSLMLSKEGEVYAVGNNTLSQLGVQEVVHSTSTPVRVVGLQKETVVKIDANSHSAAITIKGELYLWGSGVFGLYRTPFRINTISNPVENVTLGSSMGSAIDNKGLVWTWGTNICGELGVGDHDPRVHPYPVLSLKGKQVTQLKCGGSFVVALGRTLKKEIPGLKLKNAHEYIRSSLNLSHGSLLGTKGHNKRSSSGSNLLKNHSNNSVNRYQQLDFNGNSPKRTTTLQKLMHKRQSRSIMHKQSSDKAFKSSKSRLRMKQQNIPYEQPFTQDESKEFLNRISHSNLGSLASQKFYAFNESPSPKPIDTYKQFKEAIKNTHLEPIVEQHQSQLQQQHTFSGSGYGSTNQKEAKIKDLSTDNKQLRTELDLKTKDNKQQRQQIEFLEKQIERLRNGWSFSMQEQQQAQASTKKLVSKVQSLKLKKKDMVSIIKQFKDQQTSIQDEKDQLFTEKHQLMAQISEVDSQNIILKDQLRQSESETQELATEITEFQRDLTQIQLQSKNVEDGLLRQLSDVSEKYKVLLRERDEYQRQQSALQKKYDVIYFDTKDNDTYVLSLEKENNFLREEIERSRFSKDKQEYGKFVNKLVHIKKKGEANDDQNDILLNSRSFQNSDKCPFSEVRDNENRQKILPTIIQEKIENKIVETKQESRQQQVDEGMSKDLKQSYNQKLLKSIEKKTLKENYGFYR